MRATFCEHISFTGDYLWPRSGFSEVDFNS